MTLHLRPPLFFLAAIAALLAGCGATMPVRVLDDGESRLVASLGGPISTSVVPTGLTPYATLGLYHGLDSTTTIGGSIHATMLAFGVAGVDVGMAHRVLRQEGARPELTASIQALVFTDFHTFGSSRIWPNASLSASWDIAGWLPYAGCHLTTQHTRFDVFVSPYVGVSVPLSARWTVQLETIWQAANKDSRSGIFEGTTSLAGSGSLGAFLAGSMRL